MCLLEYADSNTRGDLFICCLNMQESVELEIGQPGGANFCVESSVEVRCAEELNVDNFLVCLHTELMLKLYKCSNSGFMV